MDAVTVRGVTKRYRVGVGKARVREMIPAPLDVPLQRVFTKWWAKDTFNALEDVSFAVPAGSSLGLIGHNGAGKTTLLKIISCVTAPTTGSVSVAGRVAALIDLIVGVHPEMTGRENAYLLGAMHGVTRRQMTPKIERIIEFAELGDMADTPLKRYSAGMAARLGMGVITALDSDILLVDEVLSVGDTSFQRKCIRWLDGFRGDGGTLLFVSHNLGLVRNMTERVVWIDHGKVVEDGPTGLVLKRYAGALERRDATTMFRKRAGSKAQLASRGLNRWGAGGARIEDVHVADQTEDGCDLRVAITYEAAELDEAVFCVGFVDEGGQEIGGTASPPIEVVRPSGEVTCSLSLEPLRSGVYFAIVAILSTDGRIRDRWQLDRAVVVDHDGRASFADDFGPVRIDAAWSGATGELGVGERGADPA